MKKITFCFAMLLMAVFSSFGQVQIGDGVLIDKGLPFEPSRSYSYTQTIYLSSEILATGNISSLSWYYAGGNDLIGSQELTVYLGHSTKTTFTSTSNWEPIANLTQVYTGGISANGPGWVSILFQTPFAYNGTDNLVIAVKETSAESDYSEDDFYTYQVVGNRSLTLSSNSTLPNPTAPANGTLRAFAPIIALDGIAQACPKPVGLTTSDPTTTGISLYWNSMVATPLGSQYYISPTNVAPTQETTPTGNTTTEGYEIITSGLLPATKYYVWVRDVCEGGPGVWSNGSSFTTTCEPASNFFQNFNTTTNNNTLPICWSKIVYNPQGNATTSSLGITSEDGYTGKSVEFYRNGDATSDLILISPPISNLASGSNRLRFYAKNFSSSPVGGFKIGTLSGNIEGSTFTEVMSIAATTSFVEYVIDFTSLSSEDTYIGIKLDSSNENYLGYIDNIRWEVAPLCGDVTNITIPEATTTTATIAWESENITEWEVVYGTSASADPNTLTTSTPALVNPTVSISDLVAETTYYVWVRSKCTAGTGFWVGPVSFKTPCMPVNSISENFNSTTGGNLPNCWTKILRGSTLSMYATVKTMVPGMSNADRALELYTGFSDPTTSDDIIAISPNIGNLSAGTHRLKFFAKGLGNLEIGTMTSNTAAAEFSYLDDVNVTEVMTEYIIEFSGYSGSNTHIGFRFNSTQSFTAIVIDDVTWEASPSCPDVNNITFSDTTPTSTSVGWPASEAQQWQIVYGAPSVTDPNTLTPTLVASPSADLLELTSNTTYKIWVRSVCDGEDGNGAWSYPVLVTTACSPVNTFSETFESAVAPNLPSCWSSFVYPNTGSVGLITWQPYAGSIGVEITTTATALISPPVLISPPLANLSAGTNQLRFYANHYDVGDVEVGTINIESGNFTPIELVELTTTYQEYIVNFSSYTGPDTHIGLRIATEMAYKSIGLDNIVWEAAPSCVNVANLNVSEITTTTANVQWEAGANETSWQYVYAESTVTDPATLTPSANLDTTTASLSELTSGIAYNVWVRSVCDAASFGSWVGPYTFITKCVGADLPYLEDFESVTVPNMPNCSSIFNAVDDVNWITVNSPGNGFSSKALSYGPNETNAGSAWFFTRGVNLTAGENYTISYKYGNNSAGLHESLQVKYGTTETVEGMTLEIGDHDVTGATPQTSLVPFTVQTTGVYYFGFNAYSAANQWKLYVDDIKVEVNLSNGDFDNSNFTFYPNPVKDVLNLSYKQDITNVSVYNLLGQKVIENTINSNSAQINMSGFASGSYIVKVTSDNQTKIIKVLKQ